MFKIPLFGLSSVFYTSCTKKEPYLFIGKTHKFKNCLNLMTLVNTCCLHTVIKLSIIGSITVYDGFPHLIIVHLLSPIHSHIENCGTFLVHGCQIHSLIVPQPHYLYATFYTVLLYHSDTP